MVLEQTYHKVKSVEEAIKLAIHHANDFRYLAGGTDVIVNQFQSNDQKDCLIDITGIEELKQVKIVGHNLHIGSLVTLDTLKNHEVIAKHFPQLLEAAHSVATPMLRKTATIGGNILCENRCIFFNQSEWWREAVGYCLKCDGDICIATGGTKACFSKFVSDTAPVLICYDAQINVADHKGIQANKLEDIYTGDGLKPRNLSETSIIISIILSLDKIFKCHFQKLRPRESADFTSLTTVVSLDENGRVKIALGGVDPKPIVTEGKSISEQEELIKSVFKKARVVDNDYYSRPYRREMIKVFLTRSFKELSS
jgi:4-hydroxybenzoyl-CoA reductase subunit beta